MNSPARFKTNAYRLLIAGVATIAATAILHRDANAQSLTLSFAFDQGAATATNAPIITQTITAANNNQTYLVDIFAIVTGASGNTDLTKIGINNINFRGYSSSANNAAFASGATVGVQNDANYQANSNLSSSQLPTAADGGSTANGSTVVATTDGIADIPGVNTAGADNYIANYTGNATKWTVGGEAVSAYGTTGPNSTPNAFQTRDSAGALVANSWTFLVGQFDYTIGTVASAGEADKLTSFVPTVSSGAGANTIGNYTATVSGAFSASNTVRAGTTGNAIKATGTSPYTLGSSVTWAVAGTGGGGDSSILALSTAAETLNVLAGGSVTASAAPNSTYQLTNSNASAATSYTGTLSAPSVGSATATGFTGSGLTLAGSTSVTVPVTYTAPAAPQASSTSFTYTVSNQGNTSDTSGTKSTTFTVNVGMAAAIGNNNDTTTYGTPLNANVAHNSTYAGLISQVSSVAAGTGSDAFGGTGTATLAAKYGGGSLTEAASILAGQNITANGGTSATTANVSMKWRTRNTNEKTGQGTAVAGLNSTTGLVSDIVNIAGLSASGTDLTTGPTPTDPFALQVVYNPNLLPKQSSSVSQENSLIANSLLYLVSLNPGTGKWERSTIENTNNKGINSSILPGGEFNGSFAAFVFAQSRNNTQPFFDTNSGATSAANVNLAAITSTDLANAMGAYGADPTAHIAWAIVNHNSDFAVVPEPGTIALAGLGVLGLIAMRRRKKA